MSSAVRAVMLLMLLCPGGVTAQSYDDPQARDYILKAKRNMGITPREDCGQPDEDGAIVVCGRRGQNRLPLPEERSDADGGRVRGEVPRASTDLPNPPDCRAAIGKVNRCGSGSAPSVFFKLLQKSTDPDG